MSGLILSNKEIPRKVSFNEGGNRVRKRSIRVLFTLPGSTVRVGARLTMASSSKWRSFTAFRTNQSASLTFTHNHDTGKLLTFLSSAFCADRQPSGHTPWPSAFFPQLMTTTVAWTAARNFTLPKYVDKTVKNHPSLESLSFRALVFVSWVFVLFEREKKTEKQQVQSNQAVP
jgi:hypothetical protein